MRFSIPLALGFVVLLSGCGGIGGADGVGTDETLSPDTPIVAEGATQQFTITFNDSNSATAVAWSVKESGGGTIVPVGGVAPLVATYTAPNSVGSFHVIANVTVNGAVQKLTATVIVD
jgi:hypothetical protein